MITKRDRDILRWVEKYNSITINQCSKLFFKGNKMAYDQARKRLRYLNLEGHLKRYRKDPKSQSVYYFDKRLKEHDLKIMDVIATLHEFNLTEVMRQNKIEINKCLNYIIDGTVVIDNKYPIIIEVDYTHYTSEGKIKNLILFLETLHERSYTFLIVKQTVEEISIRNVGKQSKLIWVPWEFNRDDKLVRSLRSLLSIKNVG